MLFLKILLSDFITIYHTIKINLIFTLLKQGLEGNPFKKNHAIGIIVFSYFLKDNLGLNTFEMIQKAKTSRPLPKIRVSLPLETRTFF